MKGRLKFAALLVALAPAQALAETPEEKVINIVAKEAKNQNIFSFDYTIPTSPSLTLAGLSADKTTTSTSLKPFVLALPNFLGGAAEGQSTALDFSPSALAMPAMTYADYKKIGTRDGPEGILGYAWFHGRFGIAAYRGVADSDPTKAKASKLAAGFSTSLLKDSNPFFAAKPGHKVSVWEECTDRAFESRPPPSPALKASRRARDEAFDRGRRADGAWIELDARSEADARAWLSVDKNREEIEKLLGAGSAAKPTAQIKSALKDVQKAADAAGADLLADSNVILEKETRETFGVAAKACREAANAEALAGYDLDVGAGLLWSGRPEHFEDLGKGSGAVWIAYKQPVPIQGAVQRNSQGKVTQTWMIGGSARYAWRESVATGDKATPAFLADTLDAWAGLEMLTPTSKLALQYGWFEADARDRTLDRFSHSGERWLATAAIQIDKKAGIWANLSYGVANGTTDVRDDKKVLVTITFAPPKMLDIFN
jgi:hypothetical protein